MQLSDDKLELIFNSSKRIAKQSNDVPLGSLAHTVARELKNCVVSLWPAAERQEGDKRATVL
ncbi:hypothetical protein LCGC14_2495360, partial [marine sediment metagenome]